MVLRVRVKRPKITYKRKMVYSNRTKWLKNVNKNWYKYIGSRHLSEEEEIQQLRVLDRAGVIPYGEVYALYITSKRWCRIKQIVLNRDNRTCVTCGVKGEMQVDHKKYHGLGSEVLDDLQTLCVPCHNAKTTNHEIVGLDRYGS